MYCGAKTLPRAPPYICKPVEIVSSPNAAIGFFWICVCRVGEKHPAHTFRDNLCRGRVSARGNFPTPSARPGPKLIFFASSEGADVNYLDARLPGLKICAVRAFVRGNFHTPAARPEKI